MPKIARGFQSTLPARGATVVENDNYLFITDFNPRSPHGERPRQRVTPPNAKGISIHAPRTGSDPCPNAHPNNRFISIHAPRTGSDPRAVRIVSRSVRFQSTLPARGATPLSRLLGVVIWNFNPRSPHGERPPRRTSAFHRRNYFNPRSPHGERLPAKGTPCRS